ncbi:hypothetical protein CA264_01645 [Pontibacter actiniarum]|uniref:Uncharacterized protein n=1 Tax=Pontibacter actiniarum TaxID=323450 RepID=A0A1X9YN27_9BACT|nr:hypothetical protein CA264_01645 [Pontibacter actiniarum]
MKIALIMLRPNSSEKLGDSCTNFFMAIFMILYIVFIMFYISFPVGMYATCKAMLQQIVLN